MAILEFILVLNVMFIGATVSNAQASQTKDALITIGLGTVAGTVLGLSTLPFYGYPEDHFGNILIGAGVGLFVGLGVALYIISTPESGSDSVVAENSSQSTTDKLLASKDFSQYTVPTRDPLQKSGKYHETALPTFTQRPQQWAFAVNLLGMSF